MAYAFKRAFRAIAVTSSTTAVAFLANALSDIRPIRAFGIYAAIIIPVNFFIVILIMPSIQVVHDRHFRDKCNYRTLVCCIKTKPAGEKKAEKALMSRCFGEIYNRVIHKLRYVAVAILFVAGIAAAVIAADIGPLTE